MQLLRDKYKSKIKMYIIVLLILLLGTIGVVYAVYKLALNYTYMNIVSVINTSLGLLDEKEEGVETTKGKRAVLYSTENGETIFGDYPKDDNLRIKQEMMEICEKAGTVFGVPGKFVLGAALVESHGAMVGQPNVEQINGKVGSMYYNLSLDNIVGSGGKSFFKDAGNRDRYQDKKGEYINEDYRVGTIDTSVGGAIGLFQFEASLIYGPFTRMYRDKNDKVEAQTGVTTMSYFDETLGFLRPNPLYFPDQAINAAAKVKAHMNSHGGQIKDIKYVLPNSIEQEILYIYAMDAYRGDLTGKGKRGKDMHDAMGNLYADVYHCYSDGNLKINSLGDFSRNEYNKTNIRTLAIGKQSGNDFSGNIYGDGIKVGEEVFNKTFLDKFSNTSPHRLNYSGYFKQINNMGGSMNKLGVAHGFEALNAATYYINLWVGQISEAEKIAVVEDGETGDGSEFLWPLPGIRTISSYYGWRFHPTKKVYSLHTGIDIPAGNGTPILASKSGTVTHSGWLGDYGNAVKIDHGNGESTLYAHQTHTAVNRGDKVRAGDVVGYVGSTGASTGAHLHFEIIINGSAVNPLKYFK